MFVIRVLLVAALIVLPRTAAPMVALIGAAWVALVAVATVVTGWHRPSDIAAALLVCAGSAALIASVQTNDEWHTVPELTDASRPEPRPHPPAGMEERHPGLPN